VIYNDAAPLALECEAGLAGNLGVVRVSSGVRYEAGSTWRVSVLKPNPSPRTAEIRRPSRTQKLFDRITSHFVAG